MSGSLSVAKLVGNGRTIVTVQEGVHQLAGRGDASILVRGLGGRNRHRHGLGHLEAQVERGAGRGEALGKFLNGRAARGLTDEALIVDQRASQAVQHLKEVAVF